MKKFKLKNRIISLFGIIAILGACVASIFAGIPVSKSNGNDYSTESASAYDLNSYKTFANSVVLDMEDKVPASMGATYSIKDHYPVLAENQLDSKLCWAFAGSKVLETTLMYAKGEYYNFSEIGVAYFAYLAGMNSAINDYGNFEEFDRTIKENGIVLESDFSNDIMQQINENNHESFSYAEDYADKNLPNEVVPIYLSSNTNFKNSDNKINLIKYYIKNFGALNMALPGGTILAQNQSSEWQFYYESYVGKEDNGRPIYENHAVTLIGWNERGFIALNSWGVNKSTSNGLKASCEEVFISNEMMSRFCTTVESEKIKYPLGGASGNDDWLCGYYYVGEEDVSLKTTSAANFSSNIIVNSTNPMKNVFCYTEQIRLVYEVAEDINFDSVYVEIYKASLDVTSTFAVSYDEENNYITITWQPGTENFKFISDNGTKLFAGGTYSVRIYEDINLISVKPFMVYSGTEMSYIEFGGNNNSPYFSNLTTSASSSFDATYYIRHSKSYYLRLYLTDISNLLRSADVPDMYYYMDASVYNESTEKYESVDLSSKFRLNTEEYSKYCYELNLSLTSDYAGKLVKFEVFFSSPHYSGVEHYFTFKFFVSSITDDKVAVNVPNNTYNVVYMMNGGKNSDKNVDVYPRYANDSVTSVKLFDPQKRADSYAFEGWFTSRAFEPETKITKLDANQTGTLVLYAKWSYTDVEYFSMGLTVDKVYGYNQQVKDLTGVDFSTEAHLVYGETIGLKATFNVTNELKAKTFSLKYYYYINGRLVKEVEIVSIDDMVNVQDVYTEILGGRGDAYLAFPRLVVGDYVAEVVAVAAIKHEYSVSDSATYEISVSPKQVEIAYDVDASTFTYDKEEHLPAVSFDSSTYYIEDSSSFRKVIFNEVARVSAGTYEYTIQDISNSNYVLNVDDLNQIYRLYINTRRVTITWDNLTAVYNGKAKKPTATVIGCLPGDLVGCNLDGPTAIDVGEYTFAATTESLSNTNYTIQTETNKLTIMPAQITVRFNDVEERAQKSEAYRTKITYVIEGRLYDAEESLGITCTSLGLTATEAGEYLITGSATNKNYDINFIPASYVLTGYYYITYILPDGETYQEEVKYGEEPKGITDEILETSIFQKIKYVERDLNDGGDRYITVEVVDYTWYVVIGALIVMFVALYLIVSRKARRNKVR